jgi:hypothetical protein
MLKCYENVSKVDAANRTDGVITENRSDKEQSYGVL